MAGVVFDIQAFGFDEAEGKLKRVSYHVTNMQPGFEAAMELLEEGEKRLFKRYAGKYVDTGALMASLTQPTANDAIRDAHAQHADFGTSVWYAKFQKDKKGKSAVLKLQPTERKLIPTTLLKFVTRGIEGMLH